MPELEWHYGYFGILGVIGLGCCGLFANFKRMGWL
jgi:magnesium transporter